tara:strand:+ start:109 stop:513 length:405 start_codon:yes stop_codon:yes gene_type:complete
MESEKVKAVKSLVNTYLNVNVDLKSKNRDLINARAICYKILRDDCNMTNTAIAKHFSKNHATILHAMKEFPYMLKADSIMKKEYWFLRDEWKAQAGDYDDITQMDIIKEIKYLREQNKSLTLSVEDLQNKLNGL